MRYASLGLLVVGFGSAFGSCAVLPSQFGSDYAAINAAGLLGSLLGWLLALIGAGTLLSGKGGPQTW